MAMNEVEASSLDTGTTAIADRLLAAIAAGDQDGIRSVLSPDVVVWHNFDNVGQRVDQLLKTLGWTHRKLQGMCYEEIVRKPTPDGYVQKHVLRGTAPDGSAVEIFACLIVAIENGSITRIDEYLDTAQAAALMRR